MLSDSTSMDSIYDDVDDEQIDYFVADTSTTTNVVRNTILSIVHEEILESLNEDEIKIFELWLDGYSYKEIEEQVGVNFKKVDNTIQKVKRMIRSRLSASILPFLEG